MASGDKDNVKDFLRDLRAVPKRPHGGPFTYRSCETAVLGWVCEEAYDKAMRGRFKPFWELVSELLWSKLGASDSGAYVTVDSQGTSAFDGGICATLHDLARFGAMICKGGTSLTGVEVVKPEWVDGIFAGASDSAQAFRDDPNYPELGMLDGKFRNMFWSRAGDPDVVLCIGVYGQLVYINRRTQVVGVKLSSWPKPKETAWNGTWKGSSAVKMFEAISAFLS
ncbi:serine hydrolase [Streptomyces sp. NPDC053079]|uniref:serine hydrolase n=1 Tax=Streptomyces sp. NPDC053079 TaxID=3365697 RepID=UPI0037D07A86